MTIDTFVVIPPVRPDPVPDAEVKSAILALWSAAAASGGTRPTVGAVRAKVVVGKDRIRRITEAMLAAGELPDLPPSRRQLAGTAQGGERTAREREKARAADEARRIAMERAAARKPKVRIRPAESDHEAMMREHWGREKRIGLNAKGART